MGIKPSASVVQHLFSEAFEVVDRVEPYIDDFTVFSDSDEAHIRDLGAFLSVCAWHNILLGGPKTLLFRTRARVLGHDLGGPGGVGLHISNDKREKISKLSFPTSKKDLISKCAFLAYFLPLAPRLNEFLGRLRRLGLPSKRFTPDDKDKEDFKEAIEYLLSDAVCAVRMPSSSLEDTVAVFTDASATSKSALVCQMLHPVATSPAAGTGKKLHLVGIWSSVLSDSEALFPIWLNELTSLYSVTRRFSAFLSCRPFFLL